jgi:hypothetical protein
MLLEKHHGPSSNELLNVESAQQQNLTGRTALSAPPAKKG